MRWLHGDVRDEVVVGVVMQDGDPFPFGHGGDQQVGEADCPDLSAAPQGAPCSSLSVRRVPVWSGSA